jgi:hypothetical protein
LGDVVAQPLYLRGIAECRNLEMAATRSGKRLPDRPPYLLSRALQRDVYGRPTINFGAPGDTGYIRMGYGHSIENASDKDLSFC